MPPTAIDAFRSYVPTTLETAETALTKPADNDVCKATITKLAGNGELVAALSVEPSPVQDPSPRTSIFTATQVNAVADFEKAIKDTAAAEAAWLSGSGETFPSKRKKNAIVANRVKQFLTEGKKLADASFSGADKTAAYKAINLEFYNQLFREITFDMFDTGTYWSFGHDAAFIHSCENRIAEIDKMLEEPHKSLLPAGRAGELEQERAQHRAELDAVFTSKYVYHNNNMRETDAEESMSLMICDRTTRQVVSEKEASRNSLTPRYEVLNLKDGAKEAIYYDVKKDKYFFDGTGDEVPAARANASNIQHRDVYQWVPRRKKANEKFREGFRLDWNNDQYAQDSSISWVGWAGHCDIKAIMEAWGLVVPRSSEGTHHYSAINGETTHYDADLCNEIAAMMLEMSSTSRYTFGGYRDDDRPDRISISGQTLPRSSYPNKFTFESIELKLPGEQTATKYTPMEIFRGELLDGDPRTQPLTNDPTKPNPLFDRYGSGSDGDRVYLKNLDQDTIIHARAEVRTFNERGGLIMDTKSFTIDWNDTNAQPVLVDSEMVDGNNRKMREMYIDTANKQFITKTVQWKDDGTGKYVKSELDSRTSSVNPSSISCSHESSLDRPESWYPIIEEIWEGARGNLTFETADGSGVWNGAGRSFDGGMVKMSPDKSCALITLTTRAVYGGNPGAFLAFFDAEGKIDKKRLVAVALPFDFIWACDKPRFDPASGRESKAMQRGVVTRSGGNVNASAVTHLAEVFSCAFLKKPYFITTAEGKDFVTDDKAKFDAEVAKLEQLRTDALNGTTPPPQPPPTGSEVKLLEVADHEIQHDQYKTYKCVAQADGKVTIKMVPSLGDPDIKSIELSDGRKREDDIWKSDLEHETVTFDNVKKGTEIAVKLHGWGDGDGNDTTDNMFSLSVTGTADGQPPVQPAVVLDESVELGKSKRKHFVPIAVTPGESYTIESNALNIPRGDMDVYWEFDRQPTRGQGRYAGRLYGPSSDDESVIQVPQGVSQLYVMAYAYEDGTEVSDARITITKQ